MPHSEFYANQGGADKQVRSITNSRRLFRGITIKADATNTLSVFVGPSSLSLSSGYELAADEVISIDIDDPSKVFVVADSVTNQKQTVTATVAAGDKWTLSFGGVESDELDHDADAAAVEAALVALSTIGADNVDVVGDGPYVVEMKGDFASANQNLMSGSGGKNEVQTIGIASDHDGGTFTLTGLGTETDTLGHDASAADVQTALEAIYGVGNVEVTGGPGPDADWVVEFKGTLARTDVAALTGDGSELTGGTGTTVSVTETTKGNESTIAVAQTQDAASATYSWIAQ